jgi:hypothetical protein
MSCVCGHPERDHVQGGRCRVPDCPCEHFRPGDTLDLRRQLLAGGAPGLLYTMNRAEPTSTVWMRLGLAPKNAA